MPDFKTEDVLAVVREILAEKQPHIEYNNNGYDYAICNHCNGKSVVAFWSDEKTLSKFKHIPSCVYLIAKDMLTGYET